MLLIAAPQSSDVELLVGEQCCKGVTSAEMRGSRIMISNNENQNDKTDEMARGT